MDSIARAERAGLQPWPAKCATLMAPQPEVPNKSVRNMANTLFKYDVLAVAQVQHSRSFNPRAPEFSLALVAFETGL
jgi:hypothetical protein